jgi:hypothetical protein
MEDDFPAAHSMDTYWFAVDQAGHIGVFCSCEGGHVPAGAGDNAIEVMDALGGEADEEEDYYDRAIRLGLFYYSYDDEEFDPIATYERGLMLPKEPVHIDQLPPDLRKQAKGLCFKNIDFSRNESIQPLEQFPCDYWYKEDRVAYLCGDGKTVRPIPGMEDRFADFCKEFRKENPEKAKKLIFEGLAEEPK